MSPAVELSAGDLYRKCEFDGFAFESTDDLEDLDGLLGQVRAVEAVEFGIGIDREGYNIFAFGPDGTGKHSAVKQMLERRAKERPTPPDLCYVHNFEEPQAPRLVELPAGRGQELVRAMEHVVQELLSTLQTALESDEYQARRHRLDEELEERQNQMLSELGHEAMKDGLALVQTPVGFVFAPKSNNEEVLSAEELLELPSKERHKLEKKIDHYKQKLHSIRRQVSRWKREKREEVLELNREVSGFAVGPLLDDIRESFSELDAVLEYLAAVEKDVVENVEHLTAPREQGAEELVEAVLGRQGGDDLYLRYRVNLLVDHSETAGAPVVYEDNPTYQNLVGRVEHIPKMGTMVTDFTLVRPGALHRANGGYLLLDALKLLRHPYAWDGLKRALRAQHIKIEALAEALSLVSTYSLQPEPAKLSIKIVLFGQRMLFYLLTQVDQDFSELFKVGADFAEEIDWNADNARQYACLIAKLAREKELQPFERAAVARIMEQGARNVRDARKMSLYMGRVLDLMRESDYWACKSGRERVTVEDVERAIDAHVLRSDRVREKVQEQIQRGVLLLDTAGAKVGQVNGLSVLELSGFAFGRPSRITARVRLGKGEVIDIEREVELSGPIHSKGVLILSGFLGSRYAADRPLSLQASLVFEQSYGGIDGDSASSAELYALLSAISGIPIRQSFAVTGSVNQQGEIQAVGGLNEKIEGFFDVCSQRGLDGEQGVLIPRSNVEHLMLRRDVVEAVEQGRFHVHAVGTIDEGIELLTGVEAGEGRPDGSYPEGSVNARVEARLEELSHLAREFSSPGGKNG